MTMGWWLVHDGRNEDGSWPCPLTRTYRARVEGGWLYRTETVWPGGEKTGSMAYVPKVDTRTLRFQPPDVGLYVAEPG